MTKWVKISLKPQKLLREGLAKEVSFKFRFEKGKSWQVSERGGQGIPHSGGKITKRTLPGRLEVTKWNLKELFLGRS